MCRKGDLETLLDSLPDPLAQVTALRKVSPGGGGRHGRLLGGSLTLCGLMGRPAAFLFGVLESWHPLPRLGSFRAFPQGMQSWQGGVGCGVPGLSHQLQRDIGQTTAPLSLSFPTCEVGQNSGWGPKTVLRTASAWWGPWCVLGPVPG